nr:QWRF motif-containing protein 2-like isoform X1 [Ipomoea batatas]
MPLATPLFFLLATGDQTQPTTTPPRTADAEASLNAVALKKFTVECSNLLSQCKSWERECSFYDKCREALMDFRNEKTLWNAWIKISDLRDIVTKKRHRLQLLKQKLKLASILKGQVDIQSLKEAIGSTVDVMQALVTSVLFSHRTSIVASVRDIQAKLKKNFGKENFEVRRN